MIDSKKGVSPLVATVILIGFSVALGAVVMNWGSTVSLEPSECGDIRLQVVKVGNQDKICSGGSGIGGYVNFIVKDDAASEVDALRVWVIGSNNLISVTDISDIKQGYPISGKVPYDFDTLGDIEQVQFIPLINKEEKPLLCMEKSLVIDKPKKC